MDFYRPRKIAPMLRASCWELQHLSVSMQCCPPRWLWSIISPQRQHPPASYRAQLYGFQTSLNAALQAKLLAILFQGFSDWQIIYNSAMWCDAINCNTYTLYSHELSCTAISHNNKTMVNFWWQKSKLGCIYCITLPFSCIA